MVVGPEPPLGRAREIGRLEDALDRARSGRGALCLIAGEPGIGKSRLVGWLADRAAADGTRVAWGHCWESGGAPPYWPWIQVLRALLARDRTRSEVVSRLGAGSRALLGLLPELEEDVPGDRTDAVLEPAQASFQLMDAVARTLHAVAESGPITVILEDLHASDSSSLLVLDFVARQLHSVPVLVVGTHREAEADLEERAPLIWRAARMADTIRLTRFDEQAVERYVADVCGSTPSPELTRRLHRITDGNPLFLVETVELIRSGGGPDACGGSVPSIPDSLRSTIRERMKRLRPETRERLAVASVLGRDFTAADLAELGGSAADELTDDLAEAERAGLVEAVDRSRWRFVHMLTRDAVHSALDTESRRRLHRRRAEQLAGRLDPPWSEIAVHLDTAGAEHRAQAVDAWRRAGARAADRLAFADAADLLERALAAFDEDAEADPSSRLELLLDVADAQITAGRTDQGLASCRRAAELARAHGSAEQLARAALVRGRIFVYADIDRDLIELLAEALQRLGGSDPKRRALLTARLAAARQPSVPPEEPFELAREAIALAREVDDPRTLVDTIASACSALMDLADPEERLALNREHVRLADRLDDPVAAFRGHLRLVIDTLELGLIGELDRAVAAVGAIAERTDLPHHRWIVQASRVMLDTMAGRFAEAEARLASAAELARRTGDPNARRCLALQRISLARAQERHRTVIDDCAEMLRAAAASPGSAIWFVPALGGVLARCGADPSLLPVIGDATEREILALGDRSALCGLAEMAVRVADRERAQRLYERLREFSRLHASHGLTGLSWDGPVSRCLALLAELLDRPGDADSWFDQAAEAIDAVGGRPLAARLAYERGRSLLARGDAPAAREHLGRARAAAEELGLDGLIRLMDGLEVDGSRPAEPDSAGDDRLRLERDGELWRCRYGRADFPLTDTKGVRFLAELVERSGEEVHVLDLVAAVDGVGPVDVGDAGVQLDERARSEYRERIEVLRGELAEAEAWNVVGRAARARDEFELLSSELSRAFGLGGRARRSKAASERARVNVQRRLRDAVERIAAQDEATGRHFDAALSTGTFCRYDPA